ncbi:hypothetical protein H4Q26_013081 [Puccinia striiformis f. sp. tritici PST-130]|nr:hypothetical protein H4Q26_013081 [Puccinia striiformis f. sp. tritici PST-130]
MSPELYQGKLTPTTFPNPWRAKADGRIMRHLLTLDCNKKNHQDTEVSCCLRAENPTIVNRTSGVRVTCLDCESNPRQGQPVYCNTLALLVGRAVLPNQKAMRLAERPAHIRKKRADKSGEDYIYQFLAMDSWGNRKVVDYRDWNETIDRSHELWDKTVKGVKDDYKKYSKAFGVQDVITKGFVDILKDRKKKHEAKKILAIAEHKYYKLFNPFLRLLGFDGCHDTPVEVLHVILLGVIKYISNDFLTNTIKPKQANDLLGTWQSFITDSLDLPVLNAAYMYKHHRSMIGKDFKILLQCAPFVFYQFMNEPQQDLWRVLCQLAPYIFQTHISNMENYIKELEILVDQLLIQLMESNA